MGNTAEYESQSEADMALCCLLAFWTGGDAPQMDRLFRESGLHRPKWDEVHYADGGTYGERMIERAITTRSERYDADPQDGSVRGQDSNHEGAAGGRNGGAQDRVAYLEEKTRVVTEYGDDLESALADREARIAGLESERASLEVALADCRATLEASPSAAGSRGDDIEESRLLWMALKRAIRSE